jgi:hypothetical protein
MNLPIAEITIVYYGEANVLCEPSPDDIKQAIETNELETRGFQSHKEELKEEWVAACTVAGQLGFCLPLCLEVLSGNLAGGFVFTEDGVETYGLPSYLTWLD